MINEVYVILYCPVRAKITAIRTEPDSPIEGSDTGCLSAGSNVKVICDNVAFPVATVEFWKNGTQILVAGRCVCVCMCV